MLLQYVFSPYRMYHIHAADGSDGLDGFKTGWAALSHRRRRGTRHTRRPAPNSRRMAPLISGPSAVRPVSGRDAARESRGTVRPGSHSAQLSRPAHTLAAGPAAFDRSDNASAVGDFCVSCTVR